MNDGVMKALKQSDFERCPFATLANREAGIRAKGPTHSRAPVRHTFL